MFIVFTNTFSFNHNLYYCDSIIMSKDKGQFFDGYFFSEVHTTVVWYLLKNTLNDYLTISYQKIVKIYIRLCLVINI